MKQFFVDSTGSLSMARLMSFLVIVVILAILMIVNIVALFKGPITFIDLPAQCVYLVGVVFGGKVLQGIFGEKTVAP